MGLLNDENGKTSTTRVTLLSMLAIFVFTLVFSDLALVPDQVWSILQSVILLCLGGTAVRSTVSNVTK